MKNTALLHIVPAGLTGVLPILFCLFTASNCPAQPKPVVVMSEEDKSISKILEKEETARRAAAKAAEEHEKCPYECRVIVDEIGIAEKSLDTLQKELGKLKKLKDNLEKEIKALDDKKNKTKAETDKLAELKKRQADVEQKIKAGEILEQNSQSQLANTRALAHGLVTAAEIAGIAEGMRADRIGIDAPAGESNADRRKREKAEGDLNGNVKKILDEIEKEAASTAAKDPCDAEAVRDAVNKKLAELYKKYVDDESDPVKKVKMKAWFEQHFYIASKKGKAQPHIEQEGGGEPNDKPEHRDGLSYISIWPDQCPPPASFSIGPSAGVDFAPSLPPALFQGDDMQQLTRSVHEQPELAEALSGALGGGWEIGQPSKAPFFLNQRREAERLAGAQTTLRIGRHLGVQAGVNWGQTAAEADFHIRSLTDGTVSTGTVQTTLKRVHAQAVLRYYSGGSHPVQAFAGFGIQFSRQSAGSLAAQWGPFRWTLRDIPAESVWAGVAQTGLLFSPRHLPLNVELLGGGRVPAAAGYNKTISLFAQIALGLRF